MISTITHPPRNEALLRRYLALAMLLSGLGGASLLGVVLVLSPIALAVFALLSVDALGSAEWLDLPLRGYSWAASLAWPAGATGILLCWASRRIRHFPSNG